MTKQVQDREIIKVENLCKGFGELKVLRNINQHVNMGEVVSIIGPSGSGKSTFLRCLNLLEVPDSGKITFEGVEITDKKIDIDKHRQKMGMVDVYKRQGWYIYHEYRSSGGSASPLYGDDLCCSLYIMGRTVKI